MRRPTDYVPQGVRVIALTVHELDQVYRMRLALESIVFRELASRANEVAAELENLRPLAKEVDRADEDLRRDVLLGRATIGTGLPIDQQFHRTLARLSGMEMIVREMDRLCLLSATMIALVPNDSPKNITHVELLDAILSGNPDTAEKQIRTATEAAMSHVIPRLRDQFGYNRPVILDSTETD